MFWSTIGAGLHLYIGRRCGKIIFGLPPFHQFVRSSEKPNAHGFNGAFFEILSNDRLQLQPHASLEASLLNPCSLGVVPAEQA